MAISKHALVTFSLGTKYKDEVRCDVVPMDVCYLLLGRVVHDSLINFYSFALEGVKIVLVPNKPMETPPSTSTIVNLQSYAPFKKELQNLGTAFVLHGKKTTESLETLKISEVVPPLLDKFQDAFPDDLPDGLPPLRYIQHHVE